MINPANMFGTKKGGSSAPPPTLLALWDFSDASSLYVDAGVTNVSSDSDKIYRASDLSGNGHHLEMATESYRPLYRTAVKNGLSVAQFDAAVSQLLTNASFVESQAFSIIAVGYHDDVDMAILNGNTGTNPSLGRGSTTFSWICGAPLSQASSDDVWHRWTAVGNGASSSLQVDTATAVTGDAGATGFNGIRLGRTTSGDGLTGYIGQVEIYDGNPDLESIKSSISSKWGI